MSDQACTCDELERAETNAAIYQRQAEHSNGIAGEYATEIMDLRKVIEFALERLKMLGATDEMLRELEDKRQWVGRSKLMRRGVEP